MKPTLILDFDGVINRYDRGWRGINVVDVVNDPPVPGTAEWLERATEHWTIHVFGSRSESQLGRQAMRRYVESLLIAGLGDEERARRVHNQINFPTSKPSARLSVDDRAITFEGDWSRLDPAELLKFEPWNRRA